MTLEDMQLQLNRLAHSGMDDNHYTINLPIKRKSTRKTPSVKVENKHLIRRLSVQLSLFE